MFKRHLFRLFVAAVSVALGSASLHAQTDVAANLYAAFSKSVNTSSSVSNGFRTTTSNVTQSTKSAAGVMVEVRHIFAPLIGIEATYSFRPANQNYSSGYGNTCTPGAPYCANYVRAGSDSASASAHAQQFTVDWIPSMKVGKLRPFGVAGAGAIWIKPTSAQVSGMKTISDVSPVYVYGAGLDFAELPHLGLRLQYRGDIYQTPYLIPGVAQGASSWTHTAEPMIGVYFRL